MVFRFYQSIPLPCQEIKVKQNSWVLYRTHPACPWREHVLSYLLLFLSTMMWMFQERDKSYLLPSVLPLLPNTERCQLRLVSRHQSWVRPSPNTQLQSLSWHTTFTESQGEGKQAWYMNSFDIGRGLLLGEALTFSPIVQLIKLSFRPTRCK